MKGEEGRLDSGFRRNDEWVEGEGIRREGSARPFDRPFDKLRTGSGGAGGWIPAYAGMTEVVEGMTEVVEGMTDVFRGKG